MKKTLRLPLVFILLFSLSSMAQNNKIPYGNNDLAGQYVQSRDAQIYYEMYGEGEPIVLLHGGIMGYIDEMEGFIEKLKPRYKVIAIATRDHGKSEIGTERITYQLKTNDVMAVINVITKDSVTILGFSDGAYTGYKVASMYPERVKKLIAIGAGEQIPGLRKVVISGGPFNADNEFWKEKKELMPEPQKLEAFWNDMEYFYNNMTASKELFNSIQCPVLVMAGELDRNAPLATVIASYQMIINSQLAIIPNTGHVVFMENFDAVWASIYPFLSALENER